MNDIDKIMDEIEARADAATDEPWEARPAKTFSVMHRGEIIDEPLPACVHHVYRDEQGRRVTSFPAYCNSSGCDNDADAYFIASARTDVPKLVQALRECWAELQSNYIMPAGPSAKHDMEVRLTAILAGRK